MKQPTLIGPREFCGEDHNTDFSRDQFLCRIGVSWFVSLMHWDTSLGYYVLNLTGMKCGAWRGDDQFDASCDEIYQIVGSHKKEEEKKKES